LFYVFVPGNDVLQFMIVWTISVSDVLTKNAFFSCKFASRCSLPQKIYMLWKKVYSLQLFRSILRRVFQMGILFGCASTKKELQITSVINCCKYVLGKWSLPWKSLCWKP
jgi:hypothetical protein